MRAQVLYPSHGTACGVVNVCVGAECRECVQGTEDRGENGAGDERVKIIGACRRMLGLFMEQRISGIKFVGGHMDRPTMEKAESDVDEEGGKPTEKWQGRASEGCVDAWNGSKSTKEEEQMEKDPRKKKNKK